LMFSQLTSLSQNSPNPFSTSTTLHVTLLPTDRPTARLRVYNALGLVAADLTDRLAFSPDVPFSAELVPPGVYSCVLETASGRWIREMIVVR
jgi:hypothetical protein